MGVACHTLAQQACSERGHELLREQLQEGECFTEVEGGGCVMADDGRDGCGFVAPTGRVMSIASDGEVY